MVEKENKMTKEIGLVIWIIWFTIVVIFVLIHEEIVKKCSKKTIENADAVGLMIALIGYLLAFTIAFKK